MAESIEEIIRRIVREELATAPARQLLPSFPTPGRYGPGSIGSGGCFNCGAYHGGLACPFLSPQANTTTCQGVNT